MARMSARAKLRKPAEREIKNTEKGIMLIPKPGDIEEFVRKIPHGKLATIDEIRNKLAKKHGAQFTCPLCAGIFLRIVAEASEEDLAEGKKDIAPYWRVVKGDGKLIEKFPGGIESHAEYLKKEGHSINFARGKGAPKVADFEKNLIIF